MLMMLQLRLVRKQWLEPQSQHYVACDFQLPGRKCLHTQTKI